ncbi:spore germination protein [Paenibacillus allorhizosphaerae]|uniref:Spore germination protein GerPA n=1 Tax=Paenibacillus allorhizosphaerae TaxID=2849866 RepID=A0ABM8VC15_9BACL|nr:spore germination protein [Paenibacillus allorhizosphaerae]CAG7621717.1 putative spore germination protein GerPA [Paenibacillus allorhizosphaerae]
MPAVVGAIKILSVGPSSIVHIGDSIQLAPTSTTKTFAGAGSFNTGDYVRTYSVVSNTNTYDNDVNDANNVSADKVGVL